MSDKRWAHENRGSSEETEPPYTLPITVRRDAHQRPSEPFTIHTLPTRWPALTMRSPQRRSAPATKLIAISQAQTAPIAGAPAQRKLKTARHCTPCVFWSLGTCAVCGRCVGADRWGMLCAVEFFLLWGQPPSGCQLQTRECHAMVFVILGGRWRPLYCAAGSWQQFDRSYRRSRHWHSTASRSILKGWILKPISESPKNIRTTTARQVGPSTE